MFSMLALALLSPQTADAANLVSSTAIDGGYECIYQEPGYYDEEGFWHEAGPKFKMLSTTPCTKTLNVDGIRMNLVSSREMPVIATDVQLVRDDVVTDPDPYAMTVEVCMPLGPLDFCYETEAEDCAHAILDIGASVPVGTTCHPVEG